MPEGVRVTIAPGYDAAYPWQTIDAAEGGKSSAGYYMAPAERGGEHRAGGAVARQRWDWSGARW